MSGSVDTQIACIFLTQQDFVKGLAAYYAPWPGIADDIVQQVFFEFIAKKEQWEIQSEVRPLLAAMTKNVARRYWREKVRNMPESLRKLAEKLAENLEGSDREEVVDQQYEERRTALNRCLDSLPPKYRLLIDLRYFGTMTPMQIARHLNMKISTVNQTLYRLREKLHLCISRKLKEGDRDA